MFEGMEFYVINVDSTVSKPNLEKIILENGGKRVQNLMPTTTHLIAAKECFRVRSIVQQYKMNVIQYRWVVNCAEFGTLVELEPLYMIYSNADLLRYFEQNIDKYGDHYT